MDISNICVIGDDKRMDYVAEELYTLGFDVYREEKNINNKSMIVLAPPANEKMTRRIIPYLEYGQFLYAGAMSNRLRHQCELMQIDYVDYLKIDELTKKNAILTAKGIIKCALSYGAILDSSDNADIIRSEKRCLVAGYGFCGKALAKALTDENINAKVDVLVRRKELKSEIESNGYGFIDLNNVYSYDLNNISVVFNTIPAMIFDERLLKHFNHDTKFFDIASGDGGIDYSFCNENNIFAKQYLGIPGKEFPVEAGKAIAETIIYDINLR